ncbi:MAG: glycosyltransferase [Candidatus Nanopelagicales bacterium]
MSRRPHLLYVAWGYPPCRGGGVYRALATPNAFAAAGWDVTVLTVERETFTRYTGADESLEALIDPSITIVRTPFLWEALETDVRRWSWLRAHMPRVWRRWIKKRDQMRDLPEVGYAGWRGDLEAAAARIHAEKPVDLTVATANPATAWMAAWHLHEKGGVPYVLDQRDGWTLDVFSGDRVHERSSKIGKWETKLLADAREVWFVNEPIRAWYAKEYPEVADRMHVVMNGWDPELAPTAADPVPAQQPLTYGYLGTISKMVPLAEFVAGWQKARGDDEVVAGASCSLRGYLGFYKTPEPKNLALVQAAEESGISFGGPASKTEVADVYAGFDVLLLILGAGLYVTSGKVFEYLATGMPIVSVHEPSNAASDVLRGYPLWFPAASLSADDIAAALVKAGHAALEADVETLRAAREFGASFSRDRQLSPRVEALTASMEVPA